MENEIYKYVTANTAKIVLRNLTIRFSSPETFNDPYDSCPPCRIKNVTHRDLRNWLEILRGKTNNDNEIDMLMSSINKYSQDEVTNIIYKSLKEFRTKLNRGSRILSLTSNNKNILMWSHYTESHSGIVIGFDRIKQPFRSAIPVDYVNEPRLVESKNLITVNSISALESEFKKLFLTKYKSWCYENEFRKIFPIDNKSSESNN